MKAWELLSDESKWTTGAWARDSDGHVVDAGQKPACWCAVGAIVQCYGDGGLASSVLSRLESRLGRFAKAWNDAPERTYAEVISVLKELDI